MVSAPAGETAAKCLFLINLEENIIFQIEKEDFKQ
jgi:hypothetical protein